jgi:mono/diheme cytochrome c family protein
MQHVTVRRVALSLWGLIGLAAATFAWIAAREPTAPAAVHGIVIDGRTAFRSHCASCHECAELVAPERDVAQLVDKLASHGPAGTIEDLEIVGYLVAPGSCNDDAMQGTLPAR